MLLLNIIVCIYIYIGGSAPAASASSSSSSASASTASTSAKITKWDEFVTTYAIPFIDACNKVNGTVKIGEYTQIALNNLRHVLLASEQCSKPSDNDLLKFISPIADVLGKYPNPDNRSEYYNQEKSYNEGAPALFTWFFQPTSPKTYIIDQLEAADFYFIKILKNGKDKNDSNISAYAITFKNLLQKLAIFVQENYPTGLTWKAGGIPLSSFNQSSSSTSTSSSSVPAAPGAPAPPGPPAPPAPPAPGGPGVYSTTSSKPATSGMGAVFGELNAKGEKGVTANLKKVTADMKTKNIKAPPLEAKVPNTNNVDSSSSSANKSEVKKEPKLYLSKGTWFIEHQENNNDISIPELQLKENIYILKCKNCTIQIPSKCKSIQVDSCQRTNIIFPSVVSIFEIFNSQRCTIDVQESVPSVSLDKSNGIIISLSREAMKQPPQLISSSISECNVSVPGATDQDDPVSIYIFIQYTIIIVTHNR